MDIRGVDDQVDDKKKRTESDAKYNSFQNLVIRDEIGGKWVMLNKIVQMKQVNEISDIDQPGE
jgi:hypothetical protein